MGTSELPWGQKCMAQIPKGGLCKCTRRLETNTWEPRHLHLHRVIFLGW